MHAFVIQPLIRIFMLIPELVYQGCSSPSNNGKAKLFSKKGKLKI